RRQNRLFLCDGDALIVPQQRLVKILNRIRDRLPWVDRVGLYANTKGISMKTDEQLKELYDLGVKIAYMGLETGDDKVLKDIRKGATAEKMITMGKKIKASGIKLSVTVLVGIAGKQRSRTHAMETGKVLSAMDPDYVGALSLMLVPGTELNKDYEEGKFELITAQEMLEELGIMISCTTLSNGLFHANHASNYLPIRAKFPQDKEKTLEMISKALKGKLALKPEYMRAL
ncbi:MAG: radical SAM protein, partial [Proteobacteria bacterium]|nr:radical SAM protein [Pseudomonadota bacterium]